MVYDEMTPVSPQERVNVVLTPQHYSMKRQEMPIKYLYQAKKIAPSVFEGLLDADREYAYHILKAGDGVWDFIAYDPREIKDFLRSKGLPPEKIDRIYFAQEFVDDLDAPIKLNDDKALTTVNNTVVVVPVSALDSEATLHAPESLKPGKGGISLGGSQGYLGFEQVASLAAILILFAGMLAYEGIRYGGDNGENSAKIKQLLEAYPALQNSYTRESISKKYKTLDRKERKKREIIKRISGMIFKGATLSSLQVDQKKFSAVFDAKEKAVREKLKLLAKKEHFNTVELSNANQIKIEGEL